MHLPQTGINAHKNISGIYPEHTQHCQVWLKSANLLNNCTEQGQAREGLIAGISFP